MVAMPVPRCTPAEYLKYEREAEFRSEFLDGHIVATAGGSPAHDSISGNVFASVHGQLRGGPCRPYTSGMRMGVRPVNSYFYPDVAIVCGEPLFDDDWRDTILNPTVVIEVLSPSTEAFDRGDKFAAFRQLDSLREYVLISQDKRRVELYRRQAEGTWILIEASAPESELRLESVQCHIPLADIYESVEFSPPPPISASQSQ